MRYLPRKARRPHQSGFTLIELFVVMGIIVLLVSILIPTISHIRTSVHQTNTSSRVQALTAAIENYYHAFNAYPGPVADSEILTFGGSQKLLNGNAKGNAAQMTGTENLTVGLMGGLRLSSSLGAGNPVDTATFVPTEVGSGPLMLNPAKPAQRYKSYLEDPKIAGLEPQNGSGQWVAWNDPAHGVDSAIPHQNLFQDTAIPEFTDAYPDAMPILYIRSTSGSGSIEGASYAGSTVKKASAAYDPSQLQLYVFPSVIDTATATVAISNNTIAVNADPQVYTDFQSTVAPITTPANYFGQYTAPTVPRNKGYLLITAGPDRKYMTHDDTVNNGSVVK
jgi:prepilin-type N-terminal cleavage/methylation domain-containing protein